MKPALTDKYLLLQLHTAQRIVFVSKRSCAAVYQRSSVVRGPRFRVGTATAFRRGSIATAPHCWRIEKQVLSCKMFTSPPDPR
jgi:hypothetical protein